MSGLWQVTMNSTYWNQLFYILFHTLFGMADDKAKKHIEDIYGKK